MLMIYLQMMDSPEDRSKFEIFYYKYRNLMYRVAYDKLSNHHDAEDAVQMAFLTVIKNMDKIGDPISDETRAYLVMATESRVIDIQRLQMRRNEISLDEIEECEGFTIEYGGQDIVAKCMAKLPARYREFILLKYTVGYSNIEIAKMLDLKMTSIWKLEQRSKEKLLELCRKEGLSC